MKTINVLDLPKFNFTRSNYSVTMPWSSIEGWLNDRTLPKTIELIPDFQRGIVWTDTECSAFLEYYLAGGAANNIIYWNCPGWMTSFKGPLQLVDGLQRITAVRKLLDNKIPIFGYYYNQITGPKPLTLDWAFIWHVNNLPTREQVLNWYLALNHTGRPHHKSEIERIQLLIELERQKNEKTTIKNYRTAKSRK